MASFEKTLKESRNPVCYNGNLCSPEDIRSFSESHPTVQQVMLGRGLIGDPGMLCPKGTDAKTLQTFFDELLEEYTRLFGGSRNAMFRLKENWRYLLCRFDGAEKLGKRLKKATDVGEYRSITHEIFQNCPMKPVLEPDW